MLDTVDSATGAATGMATMAMAIALLDELWPLIALTIVRFRTTYCSQNFNICSICNIEHPWNIYQTNDTVIGHILPRYHYSLNPWYALQVLRNFYFLAYVPKS